MGLNEFDKEGEHKNLCASDSRHRPDIRALENGDWDLAGKVGLKCRENVNFLF